MNVILNCYQCVETSKEVMLCLAVCLFLVGLSSTAPTTNSSDLVVTKDFFPDNLVIYTGQHDIVDIMVPLNALNMDDDEDEDDESDADGTILFFVEGDVKEDGTVDYKGLYVLKNKTATLLLENGRDAAAINDDSKTAYFAANDGIYTYNYNTNKADKYGSITDSLISIEKENGTDIIYVLTENKEIYKVSEEGNKKDKVDNVKAEQIALDVNNNLYYYTEKKVHVITADGVKEIQGLPEYTTLRLIRPPFVIEGVPAIVDNKAYILYPNGTSSYGEVELQVKPTAYGMEATLLQYYAIDKKIYEYNVLVLLLTEVLEALSEYLNNLKDDIQSIATRSRSDLRA